MSLIYRVCLWTILYSFATSPRTLQVASCATPSPLYCCSHAFYFDMLVTPHHKESFIFIFIISALFYLDPCSVWYEIPFDWRAPWTIFILGLSDSEFSQLFFIRECLFYSYFQKIFFPLYRILSWEDVNFFPFHHLNCIPPLSSGLHCLWWEVSFNCYVSSSIYKVSLISGYLQDGLFIQ